MFKQIRLYFIVCCLNTLITSTLPAAQLLENGDFESATLNHWEDASIGLAQIDIADAEGCFLQLDTRGIQTRGRHAALLHAFNSEQTNDDQPSVSILRSSTFTAGDGLAFIALNGSPKNVSKTNIPKFQVEILDSKTDTVLLSQTLSPASIQLTDGCPSIQTTGQFSSHYLDSRHFAGQAIKIQFKQTSSGADKGLFTLIDQVVLFQAGEQALFFSRPYAQSGISISASGAPYLDSSGSFDPDRYPSVLSYSWWLNDRTYHTAQPCLSDIGEGNHQAVLYVNDGHHMISDSLQFYLPAAIGKVTGSRDLHCDVTLAVMPSLAQSETHNSAVKQVSIESNSTAITKPAVTESDSIAIKQEQQPEAINDSAMLPATGQTNDQTMPTGSIVSDQAANTPSKGGQQSKSIAKAQTTLVIASNKIQNQPPGLTNNMNSGSAVPTSASAKIVKQPGEEPPALTEANKNAYALPQSGIRWVPNSEADGKLLIATPTVFPQQIVKLLDKDGALIELARYVGRPDKHALYAFSKPGDAYPLNCMLRVGNTDYLIRLPGKTIN